MKEIIITSSVLILCIMLIRVVFRGKISGRLQYALWLLVALRLIVPSSAQIHMAIGSIEEFRIMDIAEALEERFGDVTKRLEEPVQFHMSYNSPLGERAAAFMLGEDLNLHGSADGPTSVFVAGRIGLSWMDILRGTWIGGMLVAALWMVITNIIFSRRMRKGRKEFALPEELAYLCDGKLQKADGHKHGGKKCRIRLYTTDEPISSCLYGLPGREAIYLTRDIAEDQNKLRHVVTHEMCHRKHGDSFWSILRSILICVYWMNPLVWVAAILSKRDCELACDEEALLLLGEAERIPYGETLLSIITEKSRLSDIACTATTMHGSGKGIKERIQFIAEKPKVLGAAVVSALTLIIVVSVLAFTKQPLFAGQRWEGEITLMAGDMQVKLPESIAGISGYDMAEDTGEIIIYQLASGKEAGRFCTLSYDEAAVLADEGRRIVPVGNYGLPGTDSNDDTTHIVDSDNSGVEASEESRDYLPNEQITTEDIFSGSRSVTTHKYTAAEGQTYGALSHENVFQAEGTDHTEGVPGTDINDDTTYVLDDVGSTAEKAEESRDYLPAEQITEESRDYLPNEQMVFHDDDLVTVTQHYYTSAEAPSDQCYVYVKADYSDVKERYLEEMEYINSELEAAAGHVIVTDLNRKIRQEMFAALAENRTEYLGDASRTSALVNALPQSEGLVYRGITLHTLETEPETALSLEVRYEMTAQNMADADADMLFFNASMLFATIRNLDACYFVLTQEGTTADDGTGDLDGAEREKYEEYAKLTYNRADLQEAIGTLWSDEAAGSSESYVQWLEDLYSRIIDYLL